MLQANGRGGGTTGETRQKGVGDEQISWNTPAALARGIGPAAPARAAFHGGCVDKKFADAKRSSAAA